MAGRRLNQAGITCPRPGPVRLHGLVLSASQGLAEFAAGDDRWRSEGRPWMPPALVNDERRARRDDEPVKPRSGSDLSRKHFAVRVELTDLVVPLGGCSFELPSGVADGGVLPAREIGGMGNGLA